MKTQIKITEPKAYTPPAILVELELETRAGSPATKIIPGLWEALTESFSPEDIVPEDILPGE